MKVKTTRAEFLKSLLFVEAGLSVRPFIDQSDCYIFCRGWVATFNDEICCRARTVLPKDFTGAVHAKPLVTALNAMTADDLVLTLRDKEFLIEGGKDEKAGFRMEREIVLPVDDVIPPEEWVPLPPDFMTAVERVMDAAGTNDEEFLSVCVHIHPKWIEATDRKQMCRYKLKTGVTESFLVRAKSIARVVKLDVTQVGQTDEWVHFKNSSLGFSCRRHVEDYFPLTDLFAFKGEPAKLPRGGDQAAALAGTFCEGKENDKVLVKLTAGAMVVRGEGAFGWASKSLPMEDYRGDELTFRLSPAMLTKLVKESTECELDGDKLIIRGDKWNYLTVLGKPRQDEESEPDEGGDGEDN